MNFDFSIRNGVLNNYWGHDECVTVPDGVTHINRAFERNRYIKSVVLPDTLKTIGRMAFYNCPSLTSIFIPDSVEEIDMDAFSNCASLESVSLPGGVEIQTWAFDGCKSLKKIVFRASPSKIDKKAFEYCKAIEEVHIDDVAGWCKTDFYDADSNPLSIANGFWQNGERVRELVIPETVESISSYAFANCTSIESITFKSHETIIGRNAFLGCDHLFNDTNGLIINNGVLYECLGNPQNVVIPEGITRIKKGSFSHKLEMESLTLPKSLRYVEEDAFYMGYTSKYALNAVHISDLDAWLSIEYENDGHNPLYYGKNLYLNGSLVCDLVIPDGVTEIKNHAFEGCLSLRSITIPPSVTNMVNAFSYCSQLKEVHISDLGQWASFSFSAQGSPLQYAEYLYLNGKPVCDLVIPEGVEEIGSFAFYEYKALTSVTIPASVKRIRFCAFKGCTSLNSVYISDLSAWCDISFSGDRSNPLHCAKHLYLNGKLVRDLVIPDGVELIGDFAFCKYEALTSLTVPDSVIAVGKGAFDSCKALKNITLPDTITNLGEAFPGCPNLSYYYVMEGDTVVQKYVFKIPEEIKKMYAKARVKYSITYSHEDWADDDGDSGMGYDYDNSYTIHREPKLCEMLIKDGELYGFVVDKTSNPLVINGKRSVGESHGTSRHGSGDRWELNDSPCLSRYAWIPNMSAPSRDYVFKPKSFPDGLVERVVKQVMAEDQRGHFDGSFDVTVELTAKAAADPDKTLKKLSAALGRRCTLLKKP